MFKKASLFIVLSLVWSFALYITYSSHYFEQNIKELHSSLVQLVTEPTLYHLGSHILSVIYLYSTYLIGTIFILIGIYSYLQKSNSIVIINFFNLMCVTGLAIIFAKPSSLDLSIAKEIEVFLVSIGPYLLVCFFEYFPSSSKPLILKKIKFIILSIGIGINIIFYSLSVFHWNEDKLYIEIIRLVLFVNIVLSIFICLYLIKKQWNNSKWVKSQLITLFLGIIISFSPLLFLTIIPGVLKIPGFSFSYTIISIIVFPITLAYLLTKQEVLDFSKYVKKFMLKLIPLFITFSFLNLALKSMFKLTNEQIVKLNLLIIIGFILFSYIEKKLAPLKLRSWKAKLQEVQSEKFFTQKIQDGSYLASCAKFISNVINKVIHIDGICIIWNYDSPVVLYCSGRFDKGNEKEYLIQQLLNFNRESKQIIKIDKYHYIPLNSNLKTLGAIVIGQKVNLTLFDKDDLLILEKIQSDALDLFLSAQSLYNLHMDFKHSQQTLLTVDSFNALLLNELDAEKKRLSIFLHDEVLQNLLFISNKLKALTELDTPTLYELEKSLISIINETREMCSELYPIMVEDLGLDISLRTLKRKVEENNNINVNIYYNIPFKVIPKSLSVNIFRIIKELTHNIIKHSSASAIDLSITEADNILTISIKDNGQGFILQDKVTLLSQNNMGLMTVQKKIDQLNGTFNIQSQLNLGTSIIITFPSEGGEGIEYKSINSR